MRYLILRRVFEAPSSHARAAFKYFDSTPLVQLLSVRLYSLFQFPPSPPLPQHFRTIFGCTQLTALCATHPPAPQASNYSLRSSRNTVLHPGAKITSPAERSPSTWNFRALAPSLHFATFRTTRTTCTRQTAWAAQIRLCGQWRARRALVDAIRRPVVHSLVPTALSTKSSVTFSPG